MKEPRKISAKESRGPPAPRFHPSRSWRTIQVAARLNFIVHFTLPRPNDFLSPDFSTTPTTAIMGRLHSKGKGISASAVPYSRSVPTWFKSTPESVVDQICKLARKGATPSQIGVVLRDSHGVAQVKVVTGMRIRVANSA